MIPLRKSTFIPVNPYVHRSAGPQEEGALMCSKGTNLGPAQQSSAGLLHFERWQGNWIHREPQATENPVTRFPSGGSMISESVLKIATAPMSREISQLNACDGFTTPEDIGLRRCLPKRQVRQGQFQGIAAGTLKRQCPIRGHCFLYWRIQGRAHPPRSGGFVAGARAYVRGF